MGGVRVEVRLPAAAEIDSLDGRALDDALVELEHLRRRVESAIARVVDRADTLGHHLDDGHRNVAAWVRAVTNCSPAESRRRVQTMRALRALPEVRSGLADATLGVDQVREIARLHANGRAAHHLAQSEHVLVDAARTLEYADDAVVTRRWEALADADGCHRAHDRAHTGRDFTIQQVGAEFVFTGRCGVVQGTAVREAFARFCDAEFHADWNAARAEHGDATTPGLLPRSAPQRRMDTLAAICAQAVLAAAGEGKIAPPIVNVIVDLDTFAQHLRASLDGTRPCLDPASVRDRRCETTDGAAVDPSHAVALAMVGHVRRIVLDSRGVIVDAGRLTRLYRGPIRDALKALEPRCRWLGCLLRARISAIDHMHDFAHGGTTDPANGWILCDRHNAIKSSHGYRVRDGTNPPILHRPDGTPLRPPDAA